MIVRNRAFYDPSVFTSRVRTIDDARWAILTPGEQTTDQRWATETPWLVELLARRFKIDRWTRVLDFGCGVGRLSRALIASTGCEVVGVDMSAQMRELAIDYVGQPTRFRVLSPDELDRDRTTADVVLASWVLQHCEPLDPDLDRLAAAMTARSRLFVLNSFVRSVPTVGGIWVDDGLDVRSVLRNRFRPIAEDRALPAAIFGRGNNHWWGVFARP